MVAAHEWDLRGASAVGLRTVYVPRFGEGSPRSEIKTKAEGGEVDIIIRSFEELAGLLTVAKKISPEALEQLDINPAVSLQTSTHNSVKPEWSPYDSSPRRFIRHLGNGKSPPPASDEESVKFLMDDFDQMHITLDDPRYLGKSSGIMLINLALEMKRVYLNDVGDGGAVTRRQQARQPYTDPLPVTPTQPPNYNFPDSDLIEVLVDLYFQHMNRYLPLLHRPTFERAVNSGLHYVDGSFAATLLLVCAVAAKYSDDPRVMDEPKEPGGKPDPLSSGWKWFGQVPLMKTVSVSVPNLYDLQLYALVGEFFQASSVPQACWTVVGIGIRIAQDVGSSFDIDLPVECDDEYWEHSDPNLRWRQPTPEKTPSIVAYFTWYIKLNRILAFLLRTVYATNKSRILYGFVGQQWEETIVSELDSALDFWMAKLPDHPDDYIYFTSLYCFYQHIQILVHRPFIPTPNKPDNSLSFPSLAICTNAARACSHALDIQRNRFGHAPQPLTTTAFSAGVMLLLSIWGGRRSGLATDFDREMMDVKKCMDVLALAEVRSTSPFVTPKRERKQDATDDDDDDDEYLPKSAARLVRRIKKGTDSVSPRSNVGVQHRSSLQTPQYDLDYRKPPQQQQLAPPPLDPQHYWPRQSTFQPTHEQYDTYVPPRNNASLQVQPIVSVSAFGQSSGPAMYGSGRGALSSFVPARAVGTGTALGSAYSYQTSGQVVDTVGTMNLDVDMGLRQRTGDVALGLNPSGGLASNVDQALIWSNAPTSFE
ncbi:hypothetical protein C0992_005744 [Termitomyces sp. T32_za158]|nr:hypothetical protein C0992_005744 [Termitomyces sp. T32_za158]